MLRKEPTDSDEGADDEHADLDGGLGVENACCHDRAVFGEHLGEGPGEFQAGQVVA